MTAESSALLLAWSSKECYLETEWVAGSVPIASGNQLPHFHQGCLHLTSKIHQNSDDLWCRQLSLCLHVVVEEAGLVYHVARISNEIPDPIQAFFRLGLQLLKLLVLQCDLHLEIRHLCYQHHVVGLQSCHVLLLDNLFQLLIEVCGLAIA